MARMSDVYELRAERATESEVGMEYLWHQGDVGVIPHLFIEDADDLLLTRPGDLRQAERRFTHFLGGRHTAA
jgi:hypothetical protein